MTEKYHVRLYKSGLRIEYQKKVIAFDTRDVEKIKREQ